MHHKRKKAKYARGYRAGMGMVKPWKMNGVRTESKEGEKLSDHKRRHFVE